MDTLKYTVTTNLYQDGIIEQTINYEFNDLKNLLARIILNTKEKSVREALIKLGWIPPDEKINNI